MAQGTASNPSAPDPWLGQTLDGRYRIESVLGEGGLGVVYRATQIAIDRPVAVKVLLPDLLPSPALRQRFEREVKTLSRLAHPHIVTLTDSGVLENGAGYLVMELLEGESLEQRLRANGALPSDQAMGIARQILMAVAEAHDKHVLHRDIKPGNVFLLPLAGGGLHVKLLDFGLAKVRNELAADPGAYPTLTADGTIVGTPTYMAPEQAAASNVDPSCDVYSIGIVLFEMLAGRPPFDGQSKLEVIRAHLGSPVPDLADVRPGLRPSPELRALIAKALAKDRGDRYANAREMLSALDALPSPAATFVGKAEAPRLPAISGHEDTVSLRSSELATVDSAPSAKRPPAIKPAPPAKKAQQRKAQQRKAPPRALILGAVAAASLLVIVAAAWALWPSDSTDDVDTVEGNTDDVGENDSADVENVEPVDPAEDVVIEETAPNPENPFDATPLPEELREARRRIFRGRRLTDDQVREMTRYQRQHPDDPRPSLLLARHHRLGADWSATVRHYRAAFRANETARGFDPMLSDLMRALLERQSANAATQAIVQIYGRDALPEVERALDRRRLDQNDRRRLERLRNRLSSLPAG